MHAFSAPRRSVSRGVSGWLRHPDFYLHAGVLGIVALIWGFVGLSAVVMNEPQNHLDRRILLMLREPGHPDNPIGPKWVEAAWRDFTALGSNFVVALITLLVVGFLLVERNRRSALLVLAAVVGGALLSSALKLTFARPRPDVVAHLVDVSTPSFPSGHSLISAVIYPTLGALLATFSVHRRTKLYYIASALLLMLLVGLSRVYLGVHYPSDVLAGWAVGLAWSLFCWLVAHVLQRRGSLAGEHIE